MNYSFMEFTSTVLYGEELNYYNVLTKDGCTFKARLLSDKLLQNNSAPKEIVLEKNGDQWTGNADDAILYYLRFDINQRLNNK